MSDRKPLYQVLAGQLGALIRSGAFAAGGRDITHTSSYGAYGLARCVVEGIRQTVPDLAAHLLPEPGRFDPSNPGMKGFSITASRTKPAGLP